MARGNGEIDNNSNGESQAVLPDLEDNPFDGTSSEQYADDRGDSDVETDEFARIVGSVEQLLNSPAVSKLVERLLSSFETGMKKKTTLGLAESRRRQRSERVAGLTYRASRRRGQWMRFAASIVALICFTILAAMGVVGRELVATFFIAFIGYIWMEVSNARHRNE